MEGKVNPKKLPVPSRQEVACGYCSVKMQRKHLKEHTEKKHGGSAVKEKQDENQTSLTDIAFKRGNLDKNKDDSESTSKRSRAEDELLITVPICLTHCF